MTGLSQRKKESATNELRFVYDGWNLIATLNSQLSTLNSFAWGLDLSGSQQGAGLPRHSEPTAGCVLAVNFGRSTLNLQPSTPFPPSTSFVSFDGNGNVVALFNAANGSETARYEYGPFGEVILGTGLMSRANPFRFSTKYQDDETDLVYYGYRYYNASTGRWISRDPMGEKGGPNLYAFAGQNPLSKHDFLGLLTDEQVAGSCSCECLSVAVTYQPGENKLELGAYRDFISARFGNSVHVNWSVWGNPMKCRYYQDEKNSWVRLDGISPASPNIQTYHGSDGYAWSREYEDPMGVDTDYLWSGEYQVTVHWDVVFRCVSSDGRTVSRHDTFPDVVGSFTLP